MPLIKLNTQIQAPIHRVFDLARSIDAHLASTGNTHERAVAGRTAGLIEAGETVTWEATHFGVTQRLKVKITEFHRPHLFMDVMVSGAFSSMSHIHRFTEKGSGTLMTDEFCFTAPLGILGRIAERLLLVPYMRRFLDRRNQVLKRLAESSEWENYVPVSGSAPKG